MAEDGITLCMVPTVSWASKARLHKAAGGGVSALLPAPSVKLGCVQTQARADPQKKKRRNAGERSDTARDQRSAGSSVPRTQKASSKEAKSGQKSQAQAN